MPKLTSKPPKTHIVALYFEVPRTTDASELIELVNNAIEAHDGFINVLTVEVSPNDISNEYGAHDA